MSLEITRVGFSYDRKRGIGCNALEIGINGRTHELPALCANYADYENGRLSGVRIRADLFNYHHVNSESAPLSSRATRDNISKRMRYVQKTYTPSISTITVDPRGVLSDEGIRAYYDLQDNLPVDFVNGVDNPDWSFDTYRDYLERFVHFDTSKEKFPTLDLHTASSAFIQKIDYVMSHYKKFNLIWGGYGTDYPRWEAVLSRIHKWGGWCNVVHIPQKHITSSIKGQPQKRSNVGLTLLRGGTTYCFSWPVGMWKRSRSTHIKSEMQHKTQKLETRQNTLFNKQTWCYDPTPHNPKLAASLSFNSIQDELDIARQAIKNGLFYEEYCPQKTALMDSLQTIPISS